jgi:general secretion pathway protein C
MELPKSLTRIPSVADFGGSKSLAGSAPLVVSAGLAVLLAWQLVQLGWTLLGANSAPAPEPVSGQPAPGAASGGASLDLQAIVNAHLFGVAGATTPAETDPNAVATTRMNLLLLGTIARPDPALGYAIIGESASSAKVYTVGKTITGGTKLHSVYPDRVILDRGGKLEALLLPKTFKGGGGPAPAANAAVRPSPNIAQQIQAMAQANPGAITQIMRPQPVFANGQQRGYRVYPGRDRQRFAKLGLMPGDLVTEINGTPLDDPSRGMEILQSINSASEVTVTVERNGQPTQININTAAVAAEAAAVDAQPEGIPVTEMPVEPSPEEINE